MKRRPFVFGGALAVASAARGGFAQTYPSRAIRLIVPYPAGGATDFIGRNLGAALAERLGQPVVVDNRPGATTSVAAEALARAPADGYTLMLADTATLATNPSLYHKLPYDPLRDFVPIARVARIPLILVVAAESPPVSVGSLLQAARVRPGAMTYGSPGLGSPHHLATELFRRRAGIDVRHVPYRGAAPVLQDLIGGRIDFAFLDLPTAQGALAGNRVRALGVGTRHRLRALPAMPTLDEQGVAGFDAFAWQGIVAPVRLPMSLVTALYRAVDAALLGPALAQRLGDGGVEPFPAPPGRFATFVADETRRWAQVISEADIRLE
ncbi:MAG: tripartite tricarboxylate transporter substrate binding protein [Betaproteobacteria bacterium]